MTPSRPSLKGSTPAILTVPVGASRLPERRRRSVVLPAPLALSGIRLCIHQKRLNKHYPRSVMSGSLAAGRGSRS